jgi:4-hydroxy-tetrahydrodipicolinate reductase
MTLKIAVSGALGRMGRRVTALAIEAGHTVVAAIDTKEHGEDYSRIVGTDVPTCNVAGAYEGGADVLIDFSLPGGYPARLADCVRAGTPFVSGTTGLEPAHRKAEAEAAASIPVLWAANFSMGINLLQALVRQAAGILPESYDIEIVEMHHRRKVDAPSGSAIALLEAACEGAGRNPDEVVRHGREGHTGERTAREIGMHALRGGDVVGDHTVIFAADGERIEITHKASSRDTFAAGAVHAAGWIHGKAPGRYTMAQVLGLKDDA